MNSLIAFLGTWEMIVVVLVVMLLFGNRIPGMARSLGQGIVEFRKGLKGDSDKDKKQLPGDQSRSDAGSPENSNPESRD
jgi:sec-independent protein translocase protein TatA